LLWSVAGLRAYRQLKLMSSAAGVPHCAQNALLALLLTLLLASQFVQKTTKKEFLTEDEVVEL